MPSDREIVTEAFAAWMNGTGYVTSIFVDDMTWEITGRSAVSRKYPSTRQFVDEVLHPFGARFSAGDPFRPVTIRAVYENTYVWIMTLSGGKVVDGTAFYDSIAFNELWQTVTP
jgi:uncharacterized protein